MQSSSDLENLNKTDDGKTNNNYKGDLVMAYNTNAENSILYSRTFYTLYIGPNNNDTSHLIFRLSTKQILTTMKYELVPVPENLSNQSIKRIHSPPRSNSIHLIMTVLLAKMIISIILKMMANLEVTNWVTLKMRVMKKWIVHIN